MEIGISENRREDVGLSQKKRALLKNILVFANMIEMANMTTTKISPKHMGSKNGEHLPQALIKGKVFGKMNKEIKGENY